MDRLYRFKNSRPAFSVPTFDTTSELLTSIVYSVVIVLVMNWSRQAVAEHAFCERRKRIDGVLFEEPCSGGAVSLGLWDIRIGWGSELEEFVLGYVLLSQQRRLTEPERPCMSIAVL